MKTVKQRSAHRRAYRWLAGLSGPVLCLTTSAAVSVAQEVPSPAQTDTARRSIAAPVANAPMLRQVAAPRYRSRLEVEAMLIGVDGALRSCGGSVVASDDPRRKGPVKEVVLTLTIRADGQVSDVLITGDTTGNPEVARCLSVKLRALRFPAAAPEDGADMILHNRRYRFGG